MLEGPEGMGKGEEDGSLAGARDASEDDEGRRGRGLAERASGRGRRKGELEGGLGLQNGQDGVVEPGGKRRGGARLEH